MSIFSDSKYSAFRRMETLKKEIAELKSNIVEGKIANYTTEIIDLFKINNYIIGLLKYPESETFEGYKVVIWDKSQDINLLKNTISIDPHFLESNRIIMRLRYSENWKEIAIAIVQVLS